MDEKTIHPLYKTLFTGPTQKQTERLNAIEKLQNDFLDWTSQNRNATQEECEAKYQSMKIEAGL